MSNYLIPHPPTSVEEMRQAVISWRSAADGERFRIEHGLCYGNTSVAAHNAALYDRIADEIDREIKARAALAAVGEQP